jgi:hypothetical protein
LPLEELLLEELLLEELLPLESFACQDSLVKYYV